MKIFVMTDMEGCAGIVNRADWTTRDSRYYEEGKMLLTEETNACIRGLFDGGATHVSVIDGHGSGGLNNLFLDKRARYVRGFPDPWPFTLTEDFDAVVCVGQHAKAGTEYAHLCHTGNHGVIDCTINGISVGEFGEFALCAAVFNIPYIFGSGDEAFCEEAREFIPTIHTVAVKRGLMPGKGDDCTYEEYRDRNIACDHLHPEVARKLIEEGAKTAMEDFIANGDKFHIPRISPPYRMVKRLRPFSGRKGYTEIKEHDTDFLAMMNSKGIQI